ncbi:hypothetical protein BD779DRAFT_1471876 [Infundibulicybe gibba]|nr:hypothetical protein BD779DRAFT_1471876 [Infundibulicybe gibba]
MWRNPRNLAGILYPWFYLTHGLVKIWNRYYTLVALVCFRYFMFKGLSSTVLMNNIDVILAYRVWILYEKNRRLLWFLVGLVSGLHYQYWPHPRCQHIITLDPSHWHLFFYVTTPTMVVSFGLFLMTVYRCLFGDNHVRTPIFDLFLRDGAFWFLAVILVLAPEIATGALVERSRALSQLMIMFVSSK